MNDNNRNNRIFRNIENDDIDIDIDFSSNNLVSDNSLIYTGTVTDGSVLDHYNTFTPTTSSIDVNIGDLRLGDVEAVNDIVFNVNNSNEPELRICANGDFYVHGRLVIQDFEVYQAMRRFLGAAGHL